MNEHHLVRSRKETEVHIDLLEKRKSEIVEEIKEGQNIPGLTAEMVRIDAKLDALHWMLHNSKSRLHESFYGKEFQENPELIKSIGLIGLLKDSIVKALQKDKKGFEEPYLISPSEKRSYSKRDLVDAVQSGDKAGNRMVKNIIQLSMDLLDRQKETVEDFDRVEDKKENE